MKKEEKGDALFLTIDVDFFDGVQKMTVEKRKYPYFYNIFYKYLTFALPYVDCLYENTLARPQQLLCP